MAIVPTYHAFLRTADSQKRKTTVSLRVSSTDALEWVAAASGTARAATKVGLLLAAINALQLARGDNTEAFGVSSEDVSDAFIYPTAAEQVYNSNKLNIVYQTTLGGLPQIRSFSIPARDPARTVMESNGVNVSLDDGGADTFVADLVTQIEDTLLSLFGTACAVQEITVNDE